MMQAAAASTILSCPSKQHDAEQGSGCFASGSSTDDLRDATIVVDPATATALKRSERDRAGLREAMLRVPLPISGEAPGMFEGRFYHWLRMVRDPALRAGRR